ncbi:hypothetical protein [Pseudohalioglobus lutimaris]|jgi:hypothetical protein|uniref:Uncharacterized protein n=1 Tax=Pseudohalioglobus lutimaris TaxID=1737061 RepID=A0A2N5X021_9GAMM|nr:hypothetical protein [Pseudohalioglobus lutimaris]PLW67796.1 hypothetical protein C0039_15370 [Pseudohalioglobus lutimaris]
MEASIALALLDDSDSQAAQRQMRGTDPFRLGEASEALAELDTLAMGSPDAFRSAIDRKAIEGVVDTLLAQIRQIRAAEKA